MEPNIEVVETKLFNGEVADELLAQINEIVSEQGKCSIVLSGGGTPGGIYRALSLPPRVTEVNWDKVSFFWGDERWVDDQSGMSNYKMVKETMLNNITQGSPKVFPIPATTAEPKEVANLYSKTIKDNLDTNLSCNLPRFDLVLLGLGEDGHTASLFPGTDILKNKDKICYPILTEKTGQRITLGAGILFEAAKRVIFIVKGSDKAEIVKQVIEGEENIEEYPATFYKEYSDKVTWFIDSEAAVKLSTFHALK